MSTNSLPPSVTCTFAIGGKEFDPDQFTQIVAITPTRIWRQKREDLRKRPDLSNVEWSYEIRYGPCDYLDQPLRELLRLFLPFSEAIRHFAVSHNCTTSIICRIEGDLMYICLEIEAETLCQICQLGCELVFSIDAYETDTDE
jgi:hypothetical protein